MSPVAGADPVCSTTGTTWRSRCAAASKGRSTVYHLGDVVAEHEIAAGARRRLSLGPLPPGGFGVEVAVGDEVARTAVQVSATPRRCLRYGFVADSAPTATSARWSSIARRLHLTAVQFYDWAYRHADLVGGGERYDDRSATPSRWRPCDVSSRPRRCRRGDARIRRGLRRRRGRVAGAGSSGVARPTERPTRSESPLPRRPAAPEWLDHFVDDLARRGVGRVRRLPPRPVRLPAPGGAHAGAGSTLRLVRQRHRSRPGRAARRAASSSTTSTISRPGAPPRLAQDAVYIEAWPPHVTLGSLARW